MIGRDWFYDSSLESLRRHWRIAPRRALFVVTPSTFVSMVRRARVDLSDNTVFVEPTK